MKIEKTALTPVHRVEQLFTAEAELRAAALHFVEWDKSSADLKVNPDRNKHLNSARASLRAAARTFAVLAFAIEEPKP